MASMPKNIVICCDGTANEFAQDRTNVIKLSYTLQHDPSQQMSTIIPDWARWSRPAR